MQDMDFQILAIGSQIIQLQRDVFEKEKHITVLEQRLRSLKEQRARHGLSQAHRPSSPALDADQARRERLRQLLLHQMAAVRPAMAKDAFLLSAAQYEYPDASLIEVQRHLEYLELKGWLTVHQREPRWVVRLTAAGIDQVEMAGAA